MIHVSEDLPITKPKRAPERTCAGCREHDEKAALVRFAFDGARLVPDIRERLGGRGVWVHARRSCVKSAVKGGGFARVLRATVPFEAGALVEALVREHQARVEVLLGSARRARLCVVGTDECLAAIAKQSARLVVVASDARASRDVAMGAAARATVPVRVVEFAEKASLGRCFGKDEVGVVVVTDRALADSISQVATRIATLSEGE